MNQNIRYREETIYSEVSQDPIMIINTTISQQYASSYLKLPSELLINPNKDHMMSQESEIVEFEFDRNPSEDSVNLASFRSVDDEDNTGKGMCGIEMEEQMINFRWCCSLINDPDVSESCRII